METRDMVRMANQIADFFKAYPEEEAVKETAKHIKSFWEPRMRKMLDGHIPTRAAKGLTPLIIEAAAQIRKPKMDAA